MLIVWGINGIIKFFTYLQKFGNRKNELIYSFKGAVKLQNYSFI